MKYFLFIILSLFLFCEVSACMPYSRANIIIWEYNWFEKWFLPDWFYWKYNEKKEFNFIDLNWVKNIYNFWEYKKNFDAKKFYIEKNEDFNEIKKLKKWDFIVSISDYKNWDYENYWFLGSLWKINCDKNWEFSIKTLFWTTPFWKEVWRCWKYIWNILKKNELESELKKINFLCEKQVIYMKNDNNIYWIFLVNKFYLGILFWIILILFQKIYYKFFKKINKKK